MGGLDRRKGRGKMMQLYYNIKKEGNTLKTLVFSSKWLHRVNTRSKVVPEAHSATEGQWKPSTIEQIMWKTECQGLFDKVEELLVKINAKSLKYMNGTCKNFAIPQIVHIGEKKSMPKV